MVSAWVYDSASAADQREPHKCQPDIEVSSAQLDDLGILQWHLTDAQQYVAAPHSGELQRIRTERQYKNHDIIQVSPKTLPNYETKIASFFEEHLHEDEEIRFCLAGSGYFDIKSDVTQQWIRCHVTQGDMLVLPAGCYHRFTVDQENYIQAMRLFKEAPKWEAINRTEPRAEQTQVRKEYLEFIAQQQLKQQKQDGNMSAAPSDAVSNGTAAKLNGNSKQAASASESIKAQSPNGDAFILRNAAQSLATYPHMRRFNGMLYLSGLSSRRSDNTHVGAEKQPDGTWRLDAYEQTKAVLTNIQKCLREAGADMSHVIDCTCFLTDMTHYAAMNRAYNEFFTCADASPTRTTVAVHQLPHPNLLIEIKCIAAAPQQHQ